MTSKSEEPLRSTNSVPSASPDARLALAAHERPSGRYLNRELSWLDFNERVLALAERTVAARCSSGSSSSRSSASNLDEFFQVRVGSLKMQLEAGFAASGAGRRDDAGQAPARSRARVRELVAHAVAPSSPSSSCPTSPRPASTSPTGRSSTTRTAATSTRCSTSSIFPILTPLAVDPAHPFPYISNLSLNLAVVVARPGRADPADRAREGAAAACRASSSCPTASASCRSSS